MCMVSICLGGSADGWWFVSEGRKGSDMNDDPARYIDSHGAIVPCGITRPTSWGYLRITVLPELTGLPWGEVALGYVYGLRPSAIRVICGEETTDHQPERVSVYVDKDGRITHIDQSVQVALPDGISNGHELREALNGSLGERVATLIQRVSDENHKDK